MSKSPSALVHRGPHHDRVKTGCQYFNCLREKTFAEEWERLNKDEQLLQKLYVMPAKPDDPDAWRAMYPGLGPTHYKHSLQGELTPRDAKIAAMVIQWLGTNVGSCWLDETLAKVKKLKAVDSG